MLKVKLVSPEKVVATGDFDSALFPGFKGYLDVGKNHTTLLTEIKAGGVRLRSQERGLQSFFVSGGYAQIKENVLTILGDAVESQEEVDLDRARASEKRAQERLSSRSGAGVEIERALLSLERARARIEVKNFSNSPK